MAEIIKPPSRIVFNGKKSVFLAGTIDNGNSIDWQAQVERRLADRDVVVLNPRRDEWDPSWEQSIDNPLFKEQVEWELEGLETCDVILMYFAPGSKSPVTLLELGLHASSEKLIIVSPDGFWRRGNIEVVSSRYKIPLLKTLDEGLERLNELWTR